MSRNRRTSDTTISTLAEAIVRDGIQVRRRIRDLTLRAYRDRGLTIDGLAPLVEEVLIGVVAGLAGVQRPLRDELLRQVFEGLADAYAATAEHSRRAQRWEEIEERIARTVSQLASKAGEDIMNEFKNVADQIRRAGEKLEPKARAAMHTFEEKVVEPASEAATQGAKKVRRTLGVLLAAAGEMLHDLGDTIKDVRTSEPPQRTSAKGAAKPSAKRSAPRQAPSKKKTNRTASAKAPRSGSSNGRTAKRGK